MAGAAREPTTDLYESLALSRSLADIANARRGLTVSVLTRNKGEKNPFAAWQAGEGERFSKVAGRLLSLTETGEATLAKISVAAGMLSDLAQDRAR